MRAASYDGALIPAMSAAAAALDLLRYLEARRRVLVDPERVQHLVDDVDLCHITLLLNGLVEALADDYAGDPARGEELRLPLAERPARPVEEGDPGEVLVGLDREGGEVLEKGPALGVAEIGEDPLAFRG